jgi:hypothetical protein
VTNNANRALCFAPTMENALGSTDLTEQAPNKFISMILLAMASFRQSILRALYSNRPVSTKPLHALLTRRNSDAGLSSEPCLSLSINQITASSKTR